MKKILVLVAGVMTFAAAAGQSNKVQNTYIYLKPENNKLDLAKEDIDQASVHPKTGTEAKTWYYRGLTYGRIYGSKEEKFKNLDPDPLKQAYLSFIKAKELDVKNRYDSLLYFEFLHCAADYFNKGSMEYEQKKYPQSVESYETAIAIGSLPYINRLDTALFFNTALAAEAGNMIEKAIDYYKKSIDVDYGGPDVFHYLAELYLKKGDPESARKTYESGIKKYPDNNIKLYIDLINYYLGKKDMENAFGYVEIALKKDSANASLWMVYGKALEDKDTQKAIVAYKKAVEIEPENFNGYYSIGTILFNMGVEANKQVDKVPLGDEVAYKAAVAVADGYFRQALPFFEKSFQIDQGDSQLVVGLSHIYYRFKMDDKLAEIKKLIDSRK
ncbi:MAG: tetratricopeptide repeat protein [Bacteroidota bacterium]